VEHPEVASVLDVLGCVAGSPRRVQWDGAVVKPACSRCKHYQAAIGLASGLPIGNGTCRRNPPREAGWPEVYGDDWCGEFTPVDPVTDRQRTTEET
jgi:hypothetical protein